MSSQLLWYVNYDDVWMSSQLLWYDDVWMINQLLWCVILLMYECQAN